MQSELKTVLREQGLVVAMDGEDVLVETQRSTGCSGCSSESGCGTSALAKLFTGTSKTPIRVKKSLDCQVGDIVELELDESRLLQHSFMAYGLPLIGLFILAIVFSNFVESVFQVSAVVKDISAILGGGLG
ncbi:MAG TPA: hypothetical protein ENK73_00865, partial [Thiomicrospira sp.]|nr:hypothetical protein [Thiomicrospira sp.]